MVFVISIESVVRVAGIRDHFAPGVLAELIVSCASSFMIKLWAVGCGYMDAGLLI